MSFAAFAAELDVLEVPVDGPGLAAALAFHDRFTARLALAVGVFDAADDWDLDGATSAVAWLRDRGMHASEAARLVQLGSKLRRLPTLAGAWIRGDVSGGQVRVVAEQLIERHMDLFASHEAELVPALTGLSVDDTKRAMLDWRLKADALNDGPEPAMPERSLHHSPTLGNQFHTSATFDAEGGSIVDAALRVADSNDFEVSPPTRRADALVDICRFFLDNQHTKTGGRHRPHVNIVVKAETIRTQYLEAEFATTGMRVDSPTLNRLLCDCAVHRVVVNPDGTILDYGRSTRTPPVNLYNAVVVRDRHCRYPGCDRPPTWCEAHHVLPWEKQGPTSITNLVLLCSRHHHKIHLPGWRVHLAPDGEFEVVTPWGLRRITRPPGHDRKPRLPIDEGSMRDDMNAVEEHFEALFQRGEALKRVRALVAA
ncbi:MAG: hypothetical protein QOJ00_685 [Actinomycetota bacterium]|jgi:hypothetical protein